MLPCVNSIRINECQSYGRYEVTDKNGNVEYACGTHLPKLIRLMDPNKQGVTVKDVKE